LLLAGEEEFIQGNTEENVIAEDKNSKAQTKTVKAKRSRRRIKESSEDTGSDPEERDTADKGHPLEEILKELDAKR